MSRGKHIVLTAPFTEMIDHAGYFIQMGMASIPIWMEWVMDRKYPEWRNVKRFEDGSAQAAPAEKPNVDCRALWERMDAHGISQNEVARRAGISKGYLSDVMAGRRTPSGTVLKRLHAALFAPSPAELVAPVELKVLGWKKGGRNGMVIRGAGGPNSGGNPGDGTIRVGGRVPWGAEVEYAYTTGYDGHGRVSVNRLVDERGCSALLQRPEPDGA